MPEILVVTRPGSSALTVAGAMAGILRAEVSAVEPACVLSALRRPEVVLGVLDREPSPRSGTWRVATEAGKPVVLVPRDRLLAPMISRVLVPLDGTPESASAVTGAMELFAGAGLELVVLHVFDRVTVPPFWDQAAHARRSWEREFRARFCPPADARVVVRSGTPEDHVNRVAADADVQLIALGWSQRLDAGRARTVRGTVRDAEVPVMLVPLAGSELADARPDP
ncbi:universal stress protein [Actinosynnema sp. NPDC051121]